MLLTFSEPIRDAVTFDVFQRYIKHVYLQFVSNYDFFSAKVSQKYSEENSFSKATNIEKVNGFINTIGHI